MTSLLTMLRFFESEVDSWWSTAAAPFPPPPPHHCVAEPVDPGLQWIGNPYGQSGTSPPMIMAPACRCVVPSVLPTVDFVNRWWLPMTEASKVSSLSSPNSSSSVDSMDSYGGSGSISWQGDNVFSIEPSLDPSPAPFKVEISSSGAMDGGRRNQHEAMVDMRQRRRKLDEKKNKFVLRDSKRQKTGVQEEKFHCFTSFESTSSSPSKMMTAQQIMKAPVKKSQKLGDKITALQQLVSPFGKADTASVLHEAALYIKALHEQVKLLSKPYFDLMSSPDRIQGIKNGGDNYHHKSSRLRGEGLRVVPIPPSIISLANQELFDSYMTESLL